MKLTKERLSQLQPDTRSLLLLLGHASNEIIVLQKLFLMVPKGRSKSHLVNIVDAGQGFILMRLLCGKLHEAWELMTVRVLQNKTVSSKYLDALAPEGKEALEALKKHFGKSSPLTKIRKQLAFHYSDKTGIIEESFKALPAEHPWEFFLSDTHANTFYYASELVVTSAAMSLISPLQPDASGEYTQERLGAFLDIPIEVSNLTMRLFNHLITAIFDVDMPDIGGEETDIGPVAKIADVPLPFFLDEDELRKPE